ncbi:MAG: HAMP domain-containing methyl-accepting chemotaxis protein [Campylobacterota bacterium]|nr:HAMP domain-containing methyl-accepting chemotaxis protein [Campylobacterota bacterium]
MIPDFLTKKIANKIIFAMFTLMTISSLAVLYSVVYKVSDDNISNTKHSLDMLNTAMFQSLRNAMNTGDPVQIKQAEDEARKIKGVKNLTIAKSKPLIEMYSPGTKFTKDKDILISFKTKQNQIIEIDNKDGHGLRMIKPMIATKDCLMCHANQQEGDIIGIMDLTFSLDEADSKLSTLTLSLLIISTLLGWITIAIVFFVVKRAVKPLEDLKIGFENLIESNDTSIKLKSSSEDEIGEVANLFNKYMDQVNEGLKQDEIVINETNDILQKTANGFFVYEVKSKASNPHVEAMKNNLNFMIKKVKSTLDKINTTLRQYSESNYDYKIDDFGIYGDLGQVTGGIKLVGNNTSEILAMIMNTGDQLRDSTHSLSDSSAGLSKSSNTQAASLEETSAALEEITSSIKANTENTAKMSQLSNEVTKSSTQGEKLALSTTQAMEDIVHQVSSINEAIEVIDQIAFQTNILSLNAAVEAATAGEAGKGFAVVAQEVRNLASRSAEAAKDIKDIVEKATLKANDGKTVANDMIDGYKNLNSNIDNTTSLIKEVAQSSSEQQSAIVQINDAVINLDQTTQKNAATSDQISSMSQQIEDLSDKLVAAASKASFLEESRSQVCDVDLIYEIADLKVGLFNYKDDAFSRLSDRGNNTVNKFDKLDKWLDSYQLQNSNASPDIIQNLKQMNNNLHSHLTNLMNSAANFDDNSIINDYAKKVEIESMRIFGNLNNIKEDKCKKDNK